ncbi:MAG TPA: 23S rRNA (adenine(2503)-C(2))-methyltransferase RlmN [Candidatus Absconditabacterales bacterium]|nr:23S rRNA (adenine(2503)-C(2))-methyltransferase RlmN [Candidatus Absconditabacterales bacterium]HPK28134.1 23S rRNA (adenine(2503)-C(2))-methyltransferase RlmN [Candidatus Absconditabacterales bacterium]
MLPVIFDEDILLKYAKEHKIQPFRVKQIFYELFKNQNIDWDSMTTLSKDMRKELSNKFDILNLTIDKVLEDEQTTKFSFKTLDGYFIEAVLMYHWSKHVKGKLNRITLCLSSQVGCPMGCAFCVTGKMGLKRNLTWQEIISQVLYVNNYIKNKFGKKEDGTLRAVRNIVFMGMGEPLLNYDNLKKTIEILLQRERFSLSQRHITISTVGVIDGIKKLIQDKIGVGLAVSLHAPIQNLRETIVPSARVHQIPELMEVLNDYIKATNNRIFYEYIMIKGVTDGEANAKALVKLLKGQLCHVNLIPYNENPLVDFQETSIKEIQNFKQILEDGGLTVTIRDSMGREVKSACGQLGYSSVVSD